MGQDPHVRRFAEYTFDPRTGDLTGPRGRRRLQPKPAAVLELLIERAGELVGREELRERLWPDTRVEFDQGLNYCIRQIRSALDEDAHEPRFIETLPRRGYRFMASVAPSPAPSGTAPPGASRARRLRTGAAGAIGLVAVGAALWLVAVGPPTDRGNPPASNEASTAAPSAGSTAASPDRRAAVRLAVLPLSEQVREALPEDGTPAALDTLLQAIVIELANLNPAALGVVGPATTAAPRYADRPQTDIGSELDVDFVLSGGHRAEPPLTFVQIIRVPGGAHVWGRHFDPGSLDAGSLAASVAANVVEALEAAAGMTLRPR